METAVVLCGIGQLKQFKLGYFKEKGNYTPQQFTQAHELLSLSGLISRSVSDYKFHLHAVLGNADKQAIGGHLLEGTVEVTNEIVLLKSSLRIARQISPETGLDSLVLTERFEL